MSSAEAFQLVIADRRRYLVDECLLRGHMDTLSAHPHAFWTVERLSFHDFLSQQMLRPGRFMCAHHEHIVMQHLVGDKTKKKPSTTATAADSASTALPAMSDDNVISWILRVTLHPRVIQEWIQQLPATAQGRLTAENVPFSSTCVRKAFFWILAAMLHNRHAYGTPEAASVRVYDKAHVPRPIIFQDDATSTIRRDQLDARLASLLRPLRPDQRREVDWMASVERLVGRSMTPANRRTITTLSSADAEMPGWQGWYVHAEPKVMLTTIDATPPPPRRLTAAGGILGSSTGVGKTISFLSLIWAQAPWMRQWAEGKDVSAGVPLPRHRATLVLCPNQTFQQHMDKARAQLPSDGGNFVVIGVSTREQYQNTPLEILLSADIVIVSLEFLSNGFYSEACNYLRKCATESDAKRQKREQTPSPSDQRFASAWSLHQFAWARIILDESHEVFGSTASKRSYATKVLALQSCFRWCITATFPHTSPEELCGAMQFLQVSINGVPIDEHERQYRSIPAKHAWVPSGDDTFVWTDPSNGRASVMHTSLGAELRRFLHRHLFWRTTKEQVRAENPHLALFQEPKRQVVISQMARLERAEQILGTGLYSHPYNAFSYTSDSCKSTRTLLELFPCPRLWSHQEIAHERIDALCNVLRSLIQQGMQHPNLLVDVIRRRYYRRSPCCYGDERPWRVSPPEGCVCAHVAHPDREFDILEIHSDFSWTTTRWPVAERMLNGSIVPGRVPVVLKSVEWTRRYGLEYPYYVHGSLSVNESLRQSILMAETPRPTEELAARIRLHYPGADAVSIMDASEHISREWQGMLQQHLSRTPFLLEVPSWFHAANQIPCIAPRWIAAQSNLIVATLLVIHRILQHEDNRIVLFVTDTGRLERLLYWLPVVMPRVRFVRGGRDIRSKTRAIQAFETKKAGSRKRAHDASSDENKEDSLEEEAANAAAEAAQLIIFTSDSGSSGTDLVAANHLLILDTFPRHTPEERAFAHRAVKQMEGRVDRVTQPQSVTITRIVSDEPGCLSRFVDSH